MGPISNDEAKAGRTLAKEGTEKLNRETLQELMAESFGHLQAGDIVTGVVVAITDDKVVVNVSFKTEGEIPRAEFLDREGNLTVRVGDEMDVLVEKFDPTTGDIKLSRERAARIRVWEVLEEAFREKSPVRGVVVERVKGGLSVDIGVRAFLPGSLVDVRPVRRLEDFVGQTIEARIINLDRRRNNVVISRKALMEEQLAAQRQETLAKLEEGLLVTGTVRSVTDYGVFIDIGGIDGLLHVTDISWGRVGHPSEYFKVGDEAKVVVLKVDKEKGRVSLGYRQRFEDPWSHVEAKYPVGKKVRGKVTSLVDYGAFVELEEGVEGLVHVSELSWTRKVKSPKGMLHVGQEVEVVVTDVDPERRRLSLSLRQAEPNPWQEFAASHRVGDRVTGKVRNVTEFGAFVELAPGVDGLVHMSDMTWSRRVSHPSEVVQKGQQVEAVITALDVVNQRISLSMKELMPNEWDTFASAHQVGDEVDGYVTNVTDFGLFIELAPGVEGLCHVSEVERLVGGSLAEEFPKGREVRCRLIRLDFAERRIGLSLRGIPQPGPEQESVSVEEAPTHQAEELEEAAAPELTAELTSEEATAEGELAKEQKKEDA